MTTDEVEKQKEERQQAESDQETRTAEPVEEQLQTHTRQPAGRGLSRLFSSLLKRRSQCESKDGDNKDEEESKAPIADPEPELRAEGEVAQDQHSVSSADAQVSPRLLSSEGYTTLTLTLTLYGITRTSSGTSQKQA